MLDWFLWAVEGWWGKFLEGTINAQSSCSGFFTVDQSQRAAKDQLWYIAHPFAPIKAGPPLAIPQVHVAGNVLVAQETGSAELTLNVVRGVESILTRTEANASLVDWAVTRGMSGETGSLSGVDPIHSKVEDVAAISYLLGVHV